MTLLVTTCAVVSRVVLVVDFGTVAGIVGPPAVDTAADMSDPGNDLDTVVSPPEQASGTYSARRENNVVNLPPDLVHCILSLRLFHYNHSAPCRYILDTLNLAHVHWFGKSHVGCARRKPADCRSQNPAWRPAPTFCGSKTLASLRFDFRNHRECARAIIIACTAY